MGEAIVAPDADILIAKENIPSKKSKLEVRGRQGLKKHTLRDPYGEEAAK